MVNKYFKLEITWQYGPEDSLKGKTIPPLGTFRFEAKEDKIIAIGYNTSFFDNYQELTNHLIKIKNALSIVSGRSVEINTPPHGQWYDENGKRTSGNAIATVDTSIPKAFVYVEKSLTEEEKRIVEKHEKLLNDFFIKYYDCQDKIIKHISDSFQAFLNDRGKCLYYLWDILDAMRHFFNSNKSHLFNIYINNNREMCERLNIGKDYDQLAKIINDEPYLEGRHIGSNYNQLVHIPGNEKKWAEGTIKTAILNFVVTFQEICKSGKY